MNSKEKIIYKNVSESGGFKGISFEQFLDLQKNGSADMVKGTAAMLSSMDEWAKQMSIGFAEWISNHATEESTNRYSLSHSAKVETDKYSHTREELYTLFQSQSKDLSDDLKDDIPDGIFNPGK